MFNISTKSFLIIVMFCCSSIIYGQQNRLTFVLKNVTVKTALETFQKQTGISLWFNVQDVDLAKKVSVNVKRGTLNDVLDAILVGQQVSYEIKLNHLIISKRTNNNPVVKSETPQNIHKISGKVIDEKGIPIENVVARDKQTNVGTLTDESGCFSLTIPLSSKTMYFSYLGMTTCEATVKDDMVVRMTPNEQILTEIVVTALGITREKKSLGYDVQDIKTDELTKAGNTNIPDVLTGKVAGLNINLSGSGSGGSSKIVIRGNTSLADNGGNEPLWIVDGVPYNNNMTTGDYQWGGYDRAGYAYDLNSEDIESISVLKGASAAALYGSRAGSGVILVTTKKGKENNRLGIDYNYKITISPIAYSLDMQNIYGQGNNNVYNSEQTASWGTIMSGQSIPAWWDDKSEITKYLPQKNRMKDFYRTGNTQSHNISLSGGNEDGALRISLGNDYTNGTVPNQSINKTNFSLNAQQCINRFLNLETNVTYTHTVGKNRPNMGFYSTMYYLYTMPSNIQLSNLKKHRFLASDLESGIYTEQNWVTPSADRRNPYFLLDQETNRDVRDRFFGYAQANIKIAENLKFRIKQGFDYSATQTNIATRYEDNVFSNHPSLEIIKSTLKESNTEFLLSYNKNINNYSLGLNFGGNQMYSMIENIDGNSSKLSTTEDVLYLSLGSSQTVSNILSEQKINSLYGFANLSYRDFLYLSVTARNDWSSTLPSGNRSYFYPSVSLSEIITDMLNTYDVNYSKKVISYGKIRASLAQVGNDADPYQLQKTYSTKKGDYGIVYAKEPSVLPNYNLKPEISTSYEFGTAWKFYNNRIGFDFTYYHTNTKNQIMKLPMAYSSGYEYKYTNGGVIINDGVELTLNGTPIKSKNFALNLITNVAHNTTRVQKMDGSLTIHEFGELRNGLDVVAIEKHKLGELYDYGIKRDNKDNMIIGSDGLPVKTESKKVLGCIQPDFTGSFNINANYKEFSVSALFSFQKGGDIFSYTEYVAAQAGMAKCTQDREDKIVNGVHKDGTVNTTAITAQEYWQNATTSEQFIYDASFVKLQELAFGYTIPKKILKLVTHDIIDKLKVSLVGTNLIYLLKHTPGTTPDGSAMSANIFSQGIDFSPVPNTRNFGLSLSLGL